ncbi:MAG: DUF3298 domain-containing protein [Anaerolineales bacterium]|nr:DUF3298 domain-containing protein [Chloroflexota bacterium]MBL6982252.1 DUF3298 domain-containing protein [Anaerolineales bacterium]
MMRYKREFQLFVYLLFMSVACSVPQRLLSQQPSQIPTISATPTPLTSFSLSPTDIIPPPLETPEAESHIGWHLVQRQHTTEKPELNFEMTALYPYIGGSDQEYIEWFNNLIDNMVQTEVDEMDLWVADAVPPDGIGMFSEIYFSLPSSQIWGSEEDFGDILENNAQIDAHQVLMSSGHDVLSVLFVNFFYLGGAHPGSYHWSLNYDFNSGQELTLGDLFIPGSPYLERIAEFCIPQLTEKLEFDIWEDGAVPTPENYQVWALTSSGVLIIFDEYQVAPYAAGPQQVIVPYEILSDIIHPQGPIGQLAADK